MTINLLDNDTPPHFTTNIPDCRCAQHQPYSAWMTYRMTIYRFKNIPPVVRAPGMMLGTNKQNCAMIQGLIGKISPPG